MASVPTHLRTVLEVGMILLIAAAVEFVPGGRNTVAAFEAAIWAAFGAGLLFVAIRQYREHRLSLYSLGDARRGLLYGAIAVLVVTVTAQPRMWETSLGEFVWFLLVGLAVYVFFALFRYSRRY
jgi:uncharacterized membrane protein YoaK (UPF0700 family)